MKIFQGIRNWVGSLDMIPSTLTEPTRNTSSKGVLQDLPTPPVNQSQPTFKFSLLPEFNFSDGLEIQLPGRMQEKEAHQSTQITRNAEKSSWSNRLPREIFLLLVKNFPMQDAFNLMGTNRADRSLYIEEFIWRPLCPFFKNKEELSEFLKKDYKNSEKIGLKQLDNLIYKLANKSERYQPWVKGHIPTIVALFEKPLMPTEGRLQLMIKAGLLDQEQVKELEEKCEKHHKDLLVSEKSIFELGKGVKPNIEALSKINRDSIVQAATEVTDSGQKKQMLASNLFHNHVDKRGLTPLSDEIRELNNNDMVEQRLAAIERYLQNGADPNLVIELDSGWKLPLLQLVMVAAIKGGEHALAAIKILLKHEKVDPNQTDQDGRTALHQMARMLDMGGGKQVLALIRVLLEHESIDMNLTDKNEFKPLYYAERLAENGGEHALAATKLLRGSSEKLSGADNALILKSDIPGKMGHRC